MYYKIDTKKIKKLINNSLSSVDIAKENTPETFNLKDIDKLSLEQIKNFDRETASPTFVSASLLAKEIAMNDGEQDSIIKLVESGDKLCFTNWQSLGQYLGMLASNKEECIVETDTPLFKEAEEISLQEVRALIKEQYTVKWEIPANLTSESWDDPDYAIKELSKCYYEIAGDYIKKIPAHLFENKEFMNKFLELKSFSSYISNIEDDGHLNKQMYLDLVIENPKIFIVQLEGYLGYAVSEINREISDECNRRGIANHPTSDFANINLLKPGTKNFPEHKEDSLNLIQYLNDNLFSNKDKMISIIEEKIKGQSKIEFSDVTDIASLCTISVQMEDDYVNLVKKCHKNSKRDYYRSSVISIIPPDYLNDKDKTTKLIKEILLTDDDNPRSIFQRHITELYKDDPKTISNLVDNAIEYKGNNFAEVMLSDFKETATLETLKSRELFKCMVKLNNSGFKYYKDQKILSQTYSDYITKDKEMMEYIEQNGDPKTLASLPAVFLSQITNKEVIKKIIHAHPDFIGVNSRMPEWRKNIEYVATGLGARNNSIDPLNFKKSELSELVKTKEDAIMLIESYPYIYTKLPISYRKDIEVSLVAVTYEWRNIESIDAGLLLNKQFCIDILKKNKDFTKEIPKSFFNNEDFIIRLFKEIDKGEIPESIIGNLHQNIIKCVEAFDLKVGGYENFAKSFFGNQKLSTNLETNSNVTTKKMKI